MFALPPQDWRVDAACKGMDTNLFFPEGRKGHINIKKSAEARAVCARCPVRPECLRDNLHEVYGIWGGMGVRERRALRAEKAKEADRKLPGPNGLTILMIRT